MRKCLIPLFLVFACFSYAEDIPAGYYDNIEGTADSLLKVTLCRIVCNGERYDYGSTSYHTSDNPPYWQKGDPKYGTWQAFPLTDMRDDGSVWDMYSHSVRYFPNKQGDSGCSMQIEHCLPKSWWGYSKTDTRDTSLLAYRDLYNLNPSDAYANSQKSNYPPGHVTKGDKFDNGSFRMDDVKSSRYGYRCFEPEEEYRGDFARAYFYIATAYGNLQWSENYADYLNLSSYKMFSDSIIKVLLDWHRADPVSDKEICRADVISSIQHNRNPFIDFPELVEYIWGNKQGSAVKLSNLQSSANVDGCVEYIPEVDTRLLYDTLINLPSLTKANINAVSGGFASEKIQSNGGAAITMGAAATDGWVSFSKLNLNDTTTLVFRTSVYNTADEMQLDVYADETLVESITEQVVAQTRYETRHRIVIPAGTDSLTLISVGGSTKKRACLQELYLLAWRKDAAVPSAETMHDTAVKFIENGHLYIRRGNTIYDLFGRKVGSR